ncbi:MAG: class A beta-lactamase-related serine hydrolase [Candidatus Thiodiazotropha lotti]|nr:class A beta-lactamase-related serine hydrolase [Candidatus Thiodiazotropha lotti]
MFSKHYTILAALLLSLMMSLPAVAAQGYDISYVWSRNLSSVQDYRDQVAHILGPRVAKHLKVVTKGDLYGLVYRRNGNNESTTRVVKSHSKLLRARGLDAVSPIKARNWQLAGTAALPQKIEPTSKPVKMVKTVSQRKQIQDLETAVEAYISELRRSGKIARDERTGWSVFDFTTGKKLVTINEDTQFQAASLVKPFIAAAFFHKVKQGKLVYGPKSRRHMQRMIQHSNNPSTNWVIRQVGGPKSVQRILEKHYPAIFQDTLLVEYIPANGRTYKNRASVHDYSRFLYAVWNKKIAGAREIKRLMALSSSDRIYTGVPEVPKGTRVYNKTGSTARVCGDMGILSVKGANGKRYPYILIGIIEKQRSAQNYTSWIRSRSEIIRNVSAIVYKGVIAQHNGA